MCARARVNDAYPRECVCVRWKTQGEFEHMHIHTQMMLAGTFQFATATRHRALCTYMHLGWLQEARSSAADVIGSVARRWSVRFCREFTSRHCPRSETAGSVENYWCVLSGCVYATRFAPGIC